MLQLEDLQRQTISSGSPVWLQQIWTLSLSSLLYQSHRLRLKRRRNIKPSTQRFCRSGQPNTFWSNPRTHHLIRWPFLADIMAGGEQLYRDGQRSVEIVDVWADNLAEEMEKIRQIVDDFPYISMDTEFPGVVARPIGSFQSSADYHYQTLRCNVDLLKIIQLGLTFSDDQGNFPPNCCTWQFNFKFNLNEDMYAQDSIDLLIRSGIEFNRNQDSGIDVNDFGELLMSSGVVLNDHIRWVSFHSGYDFGYLLKPLPSEESEFFSTIQTYFPCIYDIKFMMKSCKNLKGGLNDLAEELNVERIGPQHQAGSDSLLTCTTFFRMRSLFFENSIDDNKYLGVLYGLSDSFNHTPQHINDK
ncbi:hypothetical protein PROFUN_12720 [Planoprotostelium fungivorum]|uniref:poly(A)-specific ribonuclease n=1 Tax=Planoprotostelium fungivorum TaxID=1890364 RepID=A0A2P6N6F4_9EUKA|nr:hypothetical protein PROFUN_12720 [Planoprotostelium fungivorum]